MGWPWSRAALWAPTAVLSTFGLLEVVEGAITSPRIPSPALAVVVAAVPSVLLLRHRAPVATWAAALASWWLLGVALESSAALVLTAVVALFACGRYGRRWSGLLVLPVTMASVVLATVLDQSSGSPREAAGWSLNALWIFGLGTWIGQKDDLVELAQVQAARRVETATTEERLHLARELHDVLAHSVSLMVVQAEAAEELLDTDPAGAQRALGHVQDAGRAALAETRDIVEALRSDTEPGSGAHDLNDVPALADRMRGAGLVVRTHIALTSDPDAELSRTAFRVVQEALTNALRHAGPGTHVDVRIQTSLDELLVMVVDDGTPTGTLLPGSGLRGMRERVERFGGALTVTTADSGWMVRATLPLAALPLVADTAERVAGGVT